MKTDSLWAAVILVSLGSCCLAWGGPSPEAAAEQGLRGQGGYDPYPAPDSGYVTDLADLLSQEEEEQIERWLWKTESSTGVEIAVVTIHSIRDYPGAANGSIEFFAKGLFDTYRIGNLPKNDGVLLLVAKADRQARIELGGGYGHARDADTNRVMQSEIIPWMKKERYAQGIVSGVRGIMREFAGIRIGTNWPLVGLLVAFPIIGLIALSLFRNGKRGWGWVCVGILIVMLLTLLRLAYLALKHIPEGSSDSWSPGGFGGGFGGGSSGGGGATGSW